MCKIPRKRERVCVGAPCRTKDEMDQLPVVVVVVVVSLKSQHPSQKLSSSEHLYKIDTCTLRYLLSFSCDHGVKKPWFHKSLKTLSLSIGELPDSFFHVYFA